MKFSLSKKNFQEKLLGCWLGKNIGGTVGAPFEWQRQVNDISFYTQRDLNGQPMPNDDLDIQLLWLCALEEKGLDVTAHRLAEYWLTYVTPHWAEYGTAKTNMRQGLPPPLSGIFQNDYKHSCGAYIRSEIWACIAPGMPKVAARYAYEDAILDHGNGEGVYAEIFTAALESAAFVIPSLRKCIDIGLSYISKNCGVAQAVRTTLDCFDAGKSWLDTRDEILRLHRGRLAHWCPISDADRAKGFDTGVLGYDVPSNIALTLVGLLWGGEDFSRVQCLCVNCGEDTDCTAATAGSIWGILYGAQAIPQKWIDPIGRGIRTVCLNLGELGFFGGQLPQNVDDLAMRTARLAYQVQEKFAWESVRLSDAASDLAQLDSRSLCASDEGRSIWGGFNGPRYDFDFFSVHIDYGIEDALIRPNQPKEITITITNQYKTQANLSLHIYSPDGWSVSPSSDGYAMSYPDNFERPLVLKYSFTAPHLTRSTHRAVLEITAEGRSTALLVPLVFLNGCCAITNGK